MEILLLKVFRKEDFSSDLVKFQLETKLNTLTIEIFFYVLAHTVGESSLKKRCNKNYFIIKCISKTIST